MSYDLSTSRSVDGGPLTVEVPGPPGGPPRAGAAWFDPLATTPGGDGPRVCIHAALAGQLGLEDGMTVRLSFEGRAALARVVVSTAVRAGALTVDPATRADLRPFPYDPVVVAPVELPDAATVTVVAVAEGEQLDRSLQRAVEGRWPVSTGGSVDLDGRARLRITAADPAEALVGPATTVVLDPHAGAAHGRGFADHSHGGPSGAAADGAAPGFDDVGGLGAQIAAVRELVELPLVRPDVYERLGVNAPRGVLFCGPPGTGKTLTARAVANEIDARFYRISGPEVVGSYSGQTEENLRRLFAEAERSAPSVVLIDEIDALAPSRRTASTLSDTRSVGQLLALMDGLREAAGVVVIGTTNQVEALDPALRRPGRFDRELYFPTPSADARLRILRVHLRRMPLSAEAAKAVGEVARAAHGFVGADLMELAREAGLAALRRTASVGDPERIDPASVVVEEGDLRGALVAVRPAALRQSLLSESNARMSDLGGMGPVKDRLVEIGRLALRNRSGPPVGVLLHGPPGTGKSSLAHALAAELGINLMVVRGPELYSQWLGESEEGVRRVFSVARRTAPVVLVLDQLDVMAPGREVSGGDPTRASQRVVGQLLTEMDAGRPAAGLVVIGITSRPGDIDPALVRPGRLGIRVDVGLPGPDDRRAILAVLLARHGDAPPWSDDDTDALVQATDGLSGAEIRYAFELAALGADGEPVTPTGVLGGVSLLGPARSTSS
ncbi:MAG: AAA family ATPase [Acidobacteriota bacterium]|nr:AAA family ATPase [Acidobacteriota bacterium]